MSGWGEGVTPVGKGEGRGGSSGERLPPTGDFGCGGGGTGPSGVRLPRLGVGE